MIPFSASILCSAGRGGNAGGGGQNLIIIDPPGARQRMDGNGLMTIIIPEMKLARGEEAKAGDGDISPCEWILLESLDCSETRPLHAGPFLTVQRRRRRRKYVRTYLFKDPTLIDDLSAYQTNFVLDRISKWAFNAFILDNVTGGRPLPNLCVHLFKTYGLLEHFHLDPVIVWKLFSIIEDGYHWRNPYHNAIHAADVTQAMHCFLQETRILEKLQPLEIFSAIVAAVTHDLDHPGVNQPFLVATSNHLVALYKNSSVLENHHWRSAMGCLNESGVSQVLGRENVALVEEQIKSLVLATDITRQQEFLTRLKAYVDTDTLDMNDPDVRHFVLQIALKCADICNPCRPWDISRKWSMKVCEEFFRQGDYERQLNLPVTPVCDRYATSVPKIQTGFLKFVVRPLFEEWHRMMNTALSTVMIDNLNANDIKWNQLLEAEQNQEALTAEMEAEESELIRNMIIENPDLINTRPSAQRSREPSESDRESRSVRFEPTIITASDSEETSEADDTMYMPKINREPRSTNEFLNIPRPDGRRHSIATGLMGDNMQIPAQLLQMASGLSSGSGSLLSISDMVSGETSTGRLVGRTTIRRESLPAGPGARGGTLSSKTILHLQKISSGRVLGEGGSSTPPAVSPLGACTAEAGEETVPPSPNRVLTEKSSCSSASTDEILDFTFSLPEPSSRSSGSPRRLTETTDFDELCPGTSILSMSNRVAHITLQQGADLEDQRRHLIRQQTCPVVSVNADGSLSQRFERPRFLSAAAAISPTAVASSSIITQHRQRNKSPESGGESDGAGLLSSARGSRGSSSEALKCEVISEEAGQSGSGSSAEASPLEIFVQQFPPSDDNDGSAPRRGSESFLSESEVRSISASNNNRSTSSLNIDPTSSPDGNSDLKQLLPFDGSCVPDARSKEVTLTSEEGKPRSNFSVSCQSGFGGLDESEFRSISSSPQLDLKVAIPTTSQKKVDLEAEMKSNPVNKIASGGRIESSSVLPPTSSSTSTSTVSISTQTDSSSFEKENIDPSRGSSTTEPPIGTPSGGSLAIVSTATTSISNLNTPTQLPSASTSGGSTSSTNVPTSTSNATSNASRLATILMWRNNRLWKSLTEEEHEDHPTSSLDLDPTEHDPHHHLHHIHGPGQLPLSNYFERWDVLMSQQSHQGTVGGRLQMRRGSAPTAAPALGCRGALDRRSDPTQYHSSSCVSSSFNFGSLFGSLQLSETPSSATGFAYGLGATTKQQQLRRGSAPVEMLRPTTLRPNPSSSNKKQPPPRMGRRGSLPTDPSANSESSFAYKWMHVFPYNEDDGLATSSLKRRSSGTELYAAAHPKLPTSSGMASWNAQLLLDQLHSSGSAGPASCAASAIWPGVRRGSLPIEVYASGSCSSESESSAGDSSDA